MKRIWNALIYGDAETKKCIGSVIFFSILAIALIIVAGISGQFNLFIFGMIAAIVAIMVSQTFTLVDDDYVAEVNKAGDKETVRSVSVQKNGLIYGSTGKKPTPQAAKDKRVTSKQSEDKMVGRICLGIKTYPNSKYLPFLHIALLPLCEPHIATAVLTLLLCYPLPLPNYLLCVKSCSLYQHRATCLCSVVCFCLCSTLRAYCVFLLRYAHKILPPVSALLPIGTS